MPLWLPKGTVLVEELEKLAKETEFAAGYVRVRTPHLVREKMYKTSGHLPYYAESMFPKMEMDEPREQRKKIAARIAELEKQLLDYAKKIAERKSGS
jgi:threonyl-tRNA synthetase